PSTADPRVYATWLASRPERAEDDAIELLVSPCAATGAPIHVVHLAAPSAFPLLRAARQQGLSISAETCPHYLSFCAEEIPDGATVFKCAPPLRDAAARDACWKGREDGTIDFVASDHSPAPPALKVGGDFV